MRGKALSVSDTVDLGEASRVLSDWQALGIDKTVSDNARALNMLQELKIASY